MKPIVRVLIVTDDGLANGGFLQWGTQPTADATGPNSREFHLGEFISVLTGYTWQGFNVEITKAHRSPRRDRRAQRNATEGGPRGRCRRLSLQSTVHRQWHVPDARRLRHDPVLFNRSVECQSGARGRSPGDRPVHGKRRRLFRDRRPRQPGRRAVQPDSSRTQHAALVLHRRPDVGFAARPERRAGCAAATGATPARHDASRQGRPGPIRGSIGRSAAGNPSDDVRRRPHRQRRVPSVSFGAASAVVFAGGCRPLSARPHARGHVRSAGKSGDAHVHARRRHRSRISGLRSGVAAVRLRAGATRARDRRDRRRGRGHHVSSARSRRSHRIVRSGRRDHVRRDRRLGRTPRGEGACRRRLDVASLLQHQPDRRPLPGKYQPVSRASAEAARLSTSPTAWAGALRATNTR